MYVILRNLRANGFTWKLSATPMIIGRGHGCDIRVFDAELSRRHARIWMDGPSVRFEDLGSSNATLVNGLPAASGILKPGDTLGAGSTLFLISDQADVLEGAPPPTDQTPITLSARIASYVRGAGEGLPEAPLHRTVHELHDLFQLGRSLGAIETVQGLADLLERTLREQFEPDELWMAWRYGKDQPLVFAGGGAAAEENARQLKLLRRAVDSHDGMVTPALIQTSAGRVPQSCMAVPLVHADQALGGFLLCARATRSVYTEEDLHYALGIASIAAPHVRAVRHVEQLRRDNSLFRSRAGLAGQLLGASAAMEQVRGLLARAGAGKLPVLIQGETGTGKELAARMLHDASPRSEGPYVVVNCAAIPDHLFESEFFGHEPGAFTGATARRQGFFEQAHGGTLFLDEVGDLCLDNQARILRAVETGAIRRVGGNRAIQVDVRIVSATNKVLSPPQFRQDLLHRINTITISMPPLRERPEDVSLLALHFLQTSISRGPVHVTGIHPEAMLQLRRQAWPGNVRELKALIDRAVLFANSPELHAEDFSPDLTISYKSSTVAVQPSDKCDIPALVALGEIERLHILRVLDACRGNIAETARVLQINRATLYRRLAEYGVGQEVESG